MVRVTHASRQGLLSVGPLALGRIVFGRSLTWGRGRQGLFRCRVPAVRQNGAPARRNRRYATESFLALACRGLKATATGSRPYGTRNVYASTFGSQAAIGKNSH